MLKKWLFGLLVLNGCGGGLNCKHLCKLESIECENSSPSVSVCVASCKQTNNALQEYDLCKKEVDDFNSCMAEISASEMFCDEDGRLAYPEGICNAENKAFYDCYFELGRE